MHHNLYYDIKSTQRFDPGSKVPLVMMKINKGNYHPSTRSFPNGKEISRPYRNPTVKFAPEYH